MSTKVINIRVSELRPAYNSLLEWLQDPSHIYIGRDMSFYVDGAYKSKWHNPYKVSKDSNGLDNSLERYEAHIRSSGLISDILELQGKTLGCWCKPKRCHGDVLLKLLDEVIKEKAKSNKKTRA